MLRSTRLQLNRHPWPPWANLLLLAAALLVSGAARRETTLEKVRREGVLHWASDGSGGAPYVFPDPANLDQSIGFEVDIANEVAKRLGVRAERFQNDWDSLPADLKAHRADLILNGFEITPAHREVSALSQPYYRYAQQLTIRSADRNRFHSIADLRGHPVGTLNGAASVEVLKRAGFPAEDIRLYSDGLQPLRDTANSRIDASLQDNPAAGYYVAQFPELENLPNTFAVGDYGIATRVEDTDLLAAIDGAVTQMKQDGTLGHILQRWNLWNALQETIGVEPGEFIRPGVTGPASPESSTLDVLAALGAGAAMTFLLTVVSMPLAVVAGLGLALMARSRAPWLRLPALAYVLVMRGTPLLVQIYIVYNALPALGEWIFHTAPNPLTLPPLVVGIVCLSANYAAYEAEIHRAGLQSVGAGQREAALALGMSEGQALHRVILPQSIRTILPPIVNDLNSLIKDSSLVSIISVPELLDTAYGIGKASASTTQMLLLAGGFYLLLSLLADGFGRWVEARLARAGRRGAAPASHIPAPTAPHHVSH